MATPDGPPPSRYRVEEREGRLVVIDSATGATPPSAAERQRAHGQGAHRDAAAPVTAVESAAAEGNRVAVDSPPAPVPARAPQPPTTFTTRAWFDAKGPRTITLSDGGQALVKARMPQVIVLVAVTLVMGVMTNFYPVVFMMVFPFLWAKGRAEIKRRVTRLIDRLERA